MLFSPVVYAALVLIPVVFLALENPLMWGRQFASSGEILWYIPFVFSLLVVCSSSLIKQPKIAPEAVRLSFSKQLFWFAMAVSCFFQIAKFLNIGDIPLLGNPLSRYQITIGGYADYPTRLLPPLCWIALIFYSQTRRRRYLLASALPVLLTILLMQRQYAAYCVLGALILFYVHKPVNVKILMGLFGAGFILLYAIGYFAVIRYGASNLSSHVSEIILPLWIMHAELTVPTTLSHYAMEMLNGDWLYGKYTFSTFYDMFGGAGESGAELVRVRYTSAETAQSIAAPFSYYVDFGIFGVLVIGLVTGMIMNYLYKLSRVSLFGSVLYTLTFLTALWSIRSGVSILSVPFIYSVLVLLAITQGGSRRLRVMRKIAQAGVVLSLMLSVTTLIYRF